MGPPGIQDVGLDDLAKLLLQFPPVEEPEYPDLYHDLDLSYTYKHVVPIDQGLFVFDILLIALIILSNIYMVYFICGQKKARTTHNVSIVSICVCEVLTAACVWPLYLYSSVNTSTAPDNIGPFVCKLQRYMNYWFRTVTIYSTLGMVSNRYFKLVEPRNHSYLTGRCTFYLNFVWFSGAAYNIWKIMLHDPLIMYLSPPDNRNLTVKRCTASDYFPKLRTGFAISDILVMYIGPLAVCFYLLAVMFRRLCRNYRIEEKAKVKNRILLAGAFTVLYMVCQLPSQLMDTYFDYSYEVTQSTVNLLYLCDTMSLMQGVLNVVAYMSCSQEFHKAWRGHCCCCVFIPPAAVAPPGGRAAQTLLQRQDAVASGSMDEAAVAATAKPTSPSLVTGAFPDTDQALETNTVT